MARLAVCVAILIISVTRPPYVYGDTYTTSVDLTSAFRLEQQIVDVLEELKDYVKSVVQEKTANGGEFMEHLTGNPIHAYRLMKRLRFDWEIVEKEIKINNWQHTVNQLERVRMNERFPKEEDFFGATSALVRLQDTYELNMTELVRGNLWGRQTHAELTAIDCLFVGKHAFNDGAYARAVEWFEESYVLAGLENNETIKRDHIAEIIQYAIDKHDDNLQEAQQNVPMSVLSDSISFRLPLKEKPATVQRSEMIRSRNYEEDDFAKFNALCRGEKLLSEDSLAQLKCWLDSRRQPYLLLMPIKVEQHSIEPEIYTFHDVLSDEEIKTVKELATPLLSRAKVLGKEPSSEMIFSSLRTSKTAWIADEVHPLMDRLSRRISLITGLKTNSSRGDAEILQVANYGIGGHYSPHHDYLLKSKTNEEMEKLSPREKAMGDRIATFMFYLNDVERGGSTAFPRAGVAVRPVRGGAAFWYNLKRNGLGNPDTLHGACPVLLGHKWVSNKWIRETVQTFNRGCLTDPTK